jgi:hypothetical protein
MLTRLSEKMAVWWLKDRALEYVYQDLELSPRTRTKKNKKSEESQKKSLVNISS